MTANLLSRLQGLTTNEAEALNAWQDTYEDFDVLPSKSIAAHCKLPRHLIRRTVRNMARKGVTVYVRGCWTDDGLPAGSGYGLTPAGRALLRTKEARDGTE